MNVYKKILQLAGANAECIAIMSDDDAKNAALNLEYANQDYLFLNPARSRRLPARLAKMQAAGNSPLYDGDQPDLLVGEKNAYKFATQLSTLYIDNWRLSAVVEWLMTRLETSMGGDEDDNIMIVAPFLLNRSWWEDYFSNLDYNGDIAYDPDEFCVCEKCGTVVSVDETTTVHVRHGEEQWCEDCVDDHAFHCDHCDEWYDNSWFNSYETTDHDYVCEDCLNSWYSICQDCGLAVHEDDVEWIDDTPYCSGCAADHEVGRVDDYRVHEYHPDIATIKHYVGGEKEHGKLIGCEIETEYGDVDERCDITQEFGGDEEFIYQAHDGSLKNFGIECITQPMSKKFFDRFDFEGWMGALSKAGARSHDTTHCGLHVHLSKEWFGSTPEKQEATAATVLVFMDKYKDNLQRLARRTATDWCHYPSEPDFGYGAKECFEKALKEKTHKGFIEEAKKNLYKGDRYHCLNTATHLPTYEFRIFRGTLNPDTFRASVELCIRLVEYAKWKNRNNSHIYSWEQFKSFKRMPKRLAAYIEKHNL